MPNPASGTVRIIPSKYQRGEATVHVIAVTGVRVLAVTRQIDAESFDLDVSGLAAGIYRVDVTLGDELYSTKLVIE